MEFDIRKIPSVDGMLRAVEQLEPLVLEATRVSVASARKGGPIVAATMRAVMKALREPIARMQGTVDAADNELAEIESGKDREGSMLQ